MEPTVAQQDRRLPVNDILVLIDDDVVALQDLVFHRDEGQRPRPAQLFLDGENAAAFGSQVAASELPATVHAATGPHPAPTKSGESGNRPAERVPVRTKVGLCGPVEQVEPVPK
jgi:hypothetical protein